MSKRRLKIAWFTPFNIQSAIGKYSKCAAEALSKYAYIDIFAIPQIKMHKTTINIILYNSTEVTKKLNRYDVVIYNIGDNSEYHSMIYNVSQLYEGIIIDHDICLHNFFLGYFSIYKNNIAEYYSAINRIYGEEAAKKISEAGLSFNNWNKLDLVKYSMLELLSEHSIGIVCHSKYHQNIIKEFYPRPTVVVPLLYTNDLEVIENHENSDGDDLTKIRVLTVGNVNFNKRIHVLIRALGMNQKLRNNIEYTVIGSLSNQEYSEFIRSEIAKYDLEDSVHLLGITDEKKLSLYYKKADIILNLRNPAYEGGSASLVEQMNLGKSIIVSNTGFYSEIPDDCVIKIDIINEEDALANCLLDILDDRQNIEKYGENAKAYAYSEFSAEAYGKKMFDFIQSTVFDKPIYDLVQRLDIELKSMNACPSMKILVTLSSEMDDLFSYAQIHSDHQV